MTLLPGPPPAEPQFPDDLWRHQREILTRMTPVLAGPHRDSRRAWVVLPPGSGKTRVGIEAALLVGRRTVALAPNTAIQGQWLAQWQRRSPGTTCSSDRGLGSDFTALTYQALASFDPEIEVDSEGRQGGDTDHLSRLRRQGRELVAALAAGPTTLVLDECHHLLDVWGELLAEILDLLPDTVVVGLTATPPGGLTAAQAALVNRLFGEVFSGPSIPALVKDGRLAPYDELAWFTAPTDRERTWLATQSDRFTELTTDLLDPTVSTEPFLSWLDAAVVRRAQEPAEAPAVPWHRFSRENPQIADAALRFHFAGLLSLPAGGRLQEAHRRPPDADDWMVLLHRYLRDCLNRSDDLRDRQMFDRIRDALPGLGFRYSAAGIRSGRSPVDRVIARSASKPVAVRKILAAESQSLGDGLRAVVICDHEQASATLPSRLIGVLDAEAGSARLALRTLADCPGLRPVLVTGRSVAAGADVARDLVADIAAAAPGLVLDPIPPDATGIVEVTGSWTSRQWVPLVTRFFESGGSTVLIGTRGMLGEGWDAHGVNTLVDLSEATTATAVVQLRGRALRIDPARPEKVAHTWSVVCVESAHPKGAADYERFVRKHDGYFGLTDSGAVMDGVAHVSPELSPYSPLADSEVGEFNVGMLRRCADRASVRTRWRVGEPYDDIATATVRVGVAPQQIVSRDRPPAVVPDRRGVPGRPPVLWTALGVVVAIGGVVAAGLAGWWIGALLLAVAAVAMVATGARTAARHGARISESAAAEPDVVAIVSATADALAAAGLVPDGAPAVRYQPDLRGAWQFSLAGATGEQADLFAAAVEEVLSPVGDPRYLIARYVVADPGPTWWSRVRAGLSAHRIEPAAVFHAVPAVLADHRRRADLFADAWRRWVSDAPALYTRSPEGALVLAAQRGSSPVDARIGLRLTWG